MNNFRIETGYSLQFICYSDIYIDFPQVQKAVFILEFKIQIPYIIRAIFNHLTWRIFS